MKIIFEGTESQTENLIILIESFKGDLPELRLDYQTKNLWCTEDVKSQYECTEEEAMEVLEDALTNEATMEQIWFAIEGIAEVFELQPKNNEDDE